MNKRSLPIWQLVFLLPILLVSSCFVLPQDTPSRNSGITATSSSQAILPTPFISREAPIFTPGNYDESIQIDSIKRTYRLVVPRAYSGKPIPLVVFLHGRGGDGRNFEIYCGMTRKAESAGFVVVYPDAMGAPTAWNAGFNHGRVESVDDVKYIKQLIAAIKQKVVVDPERIYVGGYSSGGIMSYRLASELSGTVAAIGVMSGTIGAVLPGGKELQIPDPIHPVSILHIHGLKDDVVPFAGYDSKLVNSDYFSAPRSIAFWVQQNGCKPEPRIETAFSGKVIKEIYSGCEDGVDVTLYTLPEGDHGWPVLSIPGEQSNMTASDLMWDYFSSHSLKNQAP